MDSFGPTTRISVYECVNIFLIFCLKAHSVDGSQHDLVRPIDSNIGQSLLYEMKKKEGMEWYESLVYILPEAWNRAKALLSGS